MTMKTACNIGHRLAYLKIAAMCEKAIELLIRVLERNST